MKRFTRSGKLLFLTTFVLGLSLLGGNWVSSQEREGANQEREGANGVEPAISVGQSDVDLGSVVTSSTLFTSVPNTVVTIPFSLFSRRCVLRFSAEGRATAGDRLNIRTRVDAGSCIVAGPEFHSQDASLQTRTNQSIVTVGPGAHSFRPCWRRAQLFADVALDEVQLFFRTYTVECSTN
jgi:hypothetical protein